MSVLMGIQGGTRDKKFIPAACAQWGGIRHTGLLGFADEVMFSGQNAEDAGGMPFSDEMDAPVMFSRQAVMNSMMNRLIPPKKPGTPAEQLEKRLNLLLH